MSDALDELVAEAEGMAGVIENAVSDLLSKIRTYEDAIGAIESEASDALHKADEMLGAAWEHSHQVWSAATDLHHQAHGLTTPFKFCRDDDCAALRDAIEPEWQARFDAARGLPA